MKPNLLHLPAVLYQMFKESKYAVFSFICKLGEQSLQAITILKG